MTSETERKRVEAQAARERLVGTVSELGVAVQDAKQRLVERTKAAAPYVAGGLQSVLSLVVVAAFALGGLDPYLNLLIWVNTPGVVGLVLLQVLVAVAVPVYFRRIDHSEGRWRTLVAPVLAALGMATALYLMITKIALLTGASDTVNVVLVGLVPAMIVTGAVLALWLRAKRPQVYARLGAPAPVPAEEASLVRS